MIAFVKNYYFSHPLRVILLLALLVRLVAAIWAKGYGMHDDHFGPIEQPFQIINDHSVWENRGEPHGHSIIYPAIHYYAFLCLDSAGINEPQDKMLIVRIIHALYSLLTVYFGYKIALALAGAAVARKAGLLLALLWFMPFFSVRNLIEMVCIPPLMAGLYLLIKPDKGRWTFVFAGAMFALAFVFRIQTMTLPAMAGLILLFRKEWFNCVKLASGFIAAAFLTQGIVDWLAWGYPFAAFIEYFSYNAAHGEDYTTGPFYRYILLVLGILIPPVSFMLFWGFLRDWRKSAIIVLPVLLFFIAHSVFPNKQERFILPIVPVIVVIGIAGWERLVAESQFFKKKKKLIRGFWIWFWVINTILLIPFSLTYSKRSRVESLTYLSKKDDMSGLVIVGGNVGDNYPSLFYLNKYHLPTVIIEENYLPDTLKNRIARAGAKFPNYVIFFGKERLNERTQLFEQTTLCRLELDKEIEPSFIDDLLHTLNPRGNKNQSGFVYRINY
jgi:hypothetical protein